MTKPQQKSLLAYLRQFMLRPLLAQKQVLIAIFLALLVLSITQASFLILIKGFLAAFFAGASSDEIALAYVIPEGLIARLPSLGELKMARADVVFYVPVAILLAGLLKALASYVYNLGIVRLSLKVAQNYRENVFKAIVTLPWLESSVRSPGEWMSVIMADAVFIQARLTDFSTAFIKDSVLIFSCLVTLAFIHWPAAVVLLLFSPFIAWQMGRAGKRISWFTEAFQRELGVLSGLLLGIRERFRFMRAQNGEIFERTHFEIRNRSYLEMMNGSIFLRAIVAPGMEWIGFLIFAGFIFAWTRKVPGFAVKPDVAIQFFVALGLILKPIRELGEQVARWSETIGGLRRSMQIMEIAPEPSPLSVTGAYSSESPPKLGTDPIAIADLEICYGDRVVISAQNLKLRKGQSVAIIGPSGSGKSTLLKCMAGLVKPTVWLCDVEWEKIVSRAALVSQQPFLFKDSIFNNLTYGLPQEYRSALTDFDINDVLASMNLSEWLGDGSKFLSSEFNPLQANLSGGQIQRLVIARALLRRPELLLLDEATSAVDGTTEGDISERLIRRNRENSGFLMAVTHRLRWLALYDEIWFCEDGKILFTGKHSQLMENERYRLFCSKSVED